MRWFVIMILAVVCLQFSGVAQAQSSGPIQLALVPPIQLFPPSADINGLRISFIFGDNHNMSGLDLGLANRATGNFTGVQFGIVGLVEGDGLGWMDNWLFSQVGGRFSGVQSAFVTQTNNMHGLQWGVVNLADNMSGLQFGIYNQAESLHGLQIGIVNVARNAVGHPVLVIINWAS